MPHRVAGSRDSRPLKALQIYLWHQNGQFSRLLYLRCCAASHQRDQRPNLRSCECSRLGWLGPGSAEAVSCIFRRRGRKCSLGQKSLGLDTRCSLWQRRLNHRSSGAPTAGQQSYEKSACWRLSLRRCALRSQCAARAGGELPLHYVSQGAAFATNSVGPASAFKVTVDFKESA